MFVPKTIGPAYLPHTGVNNLAVGTNFEFVIVKHIHICNVTAANHAFSISTYPDDTAVSADYALFWNQSIAAYSTFDWYGMLFLIGVVDFPLYLNGQADAVEGSLVCLVEYEVGVPTLVSGDM